MPASAFFCRSLFGGGLRLRGATPPFRCGSPPQPGAPSAGWSPPRRRSTGRSRPVRRKSQPTPLFCVTMWSACEVDDSTFRRGLAGRYEMLRPHGTPCGHGNDALLSMMRGRSTTNCPQPHPTDPDSVARAPLACVTEWPRRVALVGREV